MDIQAIRQESRKDPAYEGGNAFTRTLIACGVLTRLGEALPSWTTLREIIEKGSSGDINRGKAEFRRLHAVELKRLSAVPEGIPDVLAPVVKRLWELAVDQASATMADREASAASREAEANKSIEAANRAAEVAATDRDLARAAVEAQKTTLATLTASVETERIARLAAEEKAVQAQEESAKQRQEMKGLLDSTRDELRTAVTRLDGAEKHAIREIDRARSEAQRDVDELKKHLAIEQSASRKHENESNSLRDALSRTTKQVQQLEQELAVASALLASAKMSRSGRAAKAIKSPPFRKKLRRKDGP